jgi:hypothetical protein
MLHPNDRHAFLAGPINQADDIGNYFPTPARVCHYIALHINHNQS